MLCFSLLDFQITFKGLFVLLELFLLLLLPVSLVFDSFAEVFFFEAHFLAVFLLQSIYLELGLLYDVLHSLLQLLHLLRLLLQDISRHYDELVKARQVDVLGESDVPLLLRQVVFCLLSLQHSMQFPYEDASVVPSTEQVLHVGRYF